MRAKEALQSPHAKEWENAMHETINVLREKKSLKLMSSDLIGLLLYKDISMGRFLNTGQVFGIENKYCFW